MESFRQGGTGTHSEFDEQPTAGDDKYESGNLNMHGLAGLAAGVDFALHEHGDAATGTHPLREALVDALQRLPKISIYGPDSGSPCVDVVSFNVDDMHPHDIAIVLENMAQLQLRAGFHCAPRIHRALGTANLGGTVRVEFWSVQHAPTRANSGPGRHATCSVGGCRAGSPGLFILGPVPYAVTVAKWWIHFVWINCLNKSVPRDYLRGTSPIPPDNRHHLIGLRDWHAN